MTEPSARDRELARKTLSISEQWGEWSGPLRAAAQDQCDAVAIAIAAAREEGRAAAVSDAEALVRSTCAEAIERARNEGRREERERCAVLVEEHPDEHGDYEWDIRGCCEDMAFRIRNP